MEQKLKVNVTFQLEVPIQTDSAGRRRSIPDQIHPYVSDYFANLQKQMHFSKYGMKVSTVDSAYDPQNDFDIFEKVENVDMSESLLPFQADEVRVRWEKQKDLECWEFFKIGWKEFKTLSWTDQAKLREKHGVIWENNTWTKKKAP